LLFTNYPNGVASTSSARRSNNFFEVLHEGSSKDIEKFKQAMRNCAEVAHCYYVTGTYDFVLIVNAKDMSHFEAFSKKHLMDNPNLKHFYTHVVMDKVKVGYGISI
jgi:Lrp/AsnC family transcriptional regulator, leucine-responsive regulatory protein